MTAVRLKEVCVKSIIVAAMGYEEKWRCDGNRRYAHPREIVKLVVFAAVLAMDCGCRVFLLAAPVGC